MDVERNDIPLKLWGELDVGGYDITGVYLPDSSVNIIGLFNHHQISEFEDYCDEHLQTWEEQQTDMRQDVLFQQRRDARL